MQARCTWIDYTVDDELGVLVRLSARREDGTKENCYVKGTEPYMYAPKDEHVPNEDYIVRTEPGYESLFNDDLQKIVTETPKQAGGLTDEFSWTGEADVPYYRRVAIHDGLSGYIELPDTEETYRDKSLYHIDDISVDIDNNKEIKPRISISDIEVKVPEDESFDDMTENGSQPINVITSYDTQEDDYSVFFYDKYDNLEADKIREYISNQLEGTDIQKYSDKTIELYRGDTEVEMLQYYIDYMQRRQYDLVSGWNFTDFDMIYIRNRLKTLNKEGKDVHYAWLSPFRTSDSSRANNRKICALPSFDIMEGFCRHLTRSNWRSESLEYVASQELGIGKIDDVNINQDWRENPAKLISYNIIDVLLTVALDENNGIHNFFYDLADNCSIPIYDVFYQKRQVDGYIMSRRYDDEVLPTTDKTQDIDNAGGYVADAIQGRKQKVGVSDLKSLYPSAMITWNLSTETLSETPEEFDEYVKVPKVPEPKHVNGDIGEDEIEMEWLYASLDNEGLIPRTLRKLFKKRNREKNKMYSVDSDTEKSKWDRKQGATKVLMNSFYGVSSSKFWRLSNQYLGDAVTSTARYTLWKGRQTLDRLGVGHIYSDTDSHLIQLESNTLEERVDELEWISEEMDNDASEIFKDIYPHSLYSCEVCDADAVYDNANGEYYCTEHSGVPKKEHPFLKDSELHGDDYTCMYWEPESIYSNFIQLGNKKRYSGNIEWKEGTVYSENNIGIKGFENQRADSMEITAELQEKVLEMVLTGSEFQEVSDYVRSIIEQIDTDDENVERFALPGSLNRDLEDYTNTQITRAARYSNEHLDYQFGDGDDPFVYMVKETPPELPNTDVVAFEWDEEIPDGFVLDKEAIIERGIKKPIQPIIQEMNWKFSELRSGKKTQSMDFGSGDNPFS